MNAVAALFVDPRGPYPELLGPEVCWDESRDARLYDGPHPVVAHPPCRNWGRQRHLATGDDSDCALRAVEQVRKFGGVLEHPAGSRLWEALDMPPGIRLGDEHPCPFRLWFALPFDSFGGYTIEVDQVEWGHVARKRTWLYLVGVPREALEAPPFPGREPTHWCSGSRHEGGSRKGSPVPPGIKLCSPQQRRRTPPLFAEYLIRLAQRARKA